MADYDFSTLSPKDFELLVRDLLGAEHGWNLEAFGAGPDGGVDLRGTIDGQKLVIQCKHYTGSTFAQLHAAARAEKAKMLDVRPDHYILATSRDLTKTQKDQLFESLDGLLKRPSDILSRTDLNRLLGEHDQVERNHFKLWLASTTVLDRIVKGGIWARSEALLQDIQSRVQLYVRNPSYQRAADTLTQDRVVIISGAPGVGKSLLAETLLLTYWNEGWRIVQVGSNIDEAWDSWRPGDRQIFFYDDFLGQTSIGEVLSKNEDSRIARFASQVRANNDKRLIFTTRTQVLRQAELIYEFLRPERLSIPDCVITVGDYSKAIKARILYNHLFFSQLPRAVIKAFVVDKHYTAVIDHPNFSPRIVEQILKRTYTDVESLQTDLTTALNKPVELWGTSFETGLSELARQLLLQMLTLPVTGVSLQAFSLRLSGKSSLSLQLTQALKTLEGSWITIEDSRWHQKRMVRLANPSCRDFLLAFVENYPSTIEEILEKSQDVNQVSALIRYGLSRTGNDDAGQFEFPNIRGYLADNSQATFEKVRSLWRLDAKLERVDVEDAVTLLLAQDLLPPDFNYGSGALLQTGLRRAKTHTSKIFSD